MTDKPIADDPFAEALRQSMNDTRRDLRDTPEFQEFEQTAHTTLEAEYRRGVLSARKGIRWMWIAYWVLATLSIVQAVALWFSS